MAAASFDEFDDLDDLDFIQDGQECSVDVWDELDELEELDGLDTADMPTAADSRPANVSVLAKSPAARSADPDGYVVCPFTVIRDSREQAPWNFQKIVGLRKCRKADENKEIVIPIQVAAIPTGDYSISGFENQFAIERKSLSDAWGTFGGGRERFERELQRLTEIASHPSGNGFAAIIVEASMQTCLQNPPAREIGTGTRRFTAKSFHRTVGAWQMDFPRVQWRFEDSRWLAERTCFRWMERWWGNFGNAGANAGENVSGGHK